jgi:cyclic beta-1,2-glucan synthetase
MNPCIPIDWKGFSIEYRHGDSLYAIEVRNPRSVHTGIESVTVDGQLTDGNIPLVSDGQRHEVIVTMGASPRPPEGG